MKLPLTKSADYLDCGYSRMSEGYIDADGKAALIINPSEGEYAPCCTNEQAAHFVHCTNVHEELVTELSGMIQWVHALAKGQGGNTYEIVHNSPRMLKAIAAIAKATTS